MKAATDPGLRTGRERLLCRSDGNQEKQRADIPKKGQMHVKYDAGIDSTSLIDRLMDLRWNGVKEGKAASRNRKMTAAEHAPNSDLRTISELISTSPQHTATGRIWRYHES